MREVFESLLDVRGRLSRGGFWLLYFGMFVFSVVTLPLQLLTLGHPALLALILSPAIVVIFLGMIKRLHDRGKSGWLLLPAYGAWLLFALLGFVFRVMPGDGPLGYVSVAAVLTFFVAGAWLLFQILVLPGTLGPN